MNLDHPISHQEENELDLRGTTADWLVLIGLLHHYFPPHHFFGCYCVPTPSTTNSTLPYSSTQRVSQTLERIDS